MTVAPSRLTFLQTISLTDSRRCQPAPAELARDAGQAVILTLDRDVGQIVIHARRFAQINRDRRRHRLIGSQSPALSCRADSLPWTVGSVALVTIRK